MAKPKSTGHGPSERFSDVVKSGIEKMAGEMGVTLSVAMGMTKAYFLAKGKTQAEVTETNFSDAVAEIKAQKSVVTEARKEATSGGRERFPFNEAPDEAQELWDAGRWKELKFGAYMNFWGLRKRFAAEIGRGETISRAQVDQYQLELEAEKEKMAQLLDEKPDPDANGPMDCEVPDGFHTGKREFQLTERFKPEWADDGSVHLKVHKGGDEAIKVGNVLVLESDEPGEEPTVVIYCHACRQKVWKKIGQAKDDLPRLRGALDKATDEKEVSRLKAEVKEAEEWAEIRANFYTLAGAKRKLDAIKRGAEGKQTVLGQLKGASRKPFSGDIGSRKAGGFHNWKTQERGGKR